MAEKDVAATISAARTLHRGELPGGPVDPFDPISTSHLPWSLDLEAAAAPTVHTAQRAAQLGRSDELLDVPDQLHGVPVGRGEREGASEAEVALREAAPQSGLVERRGAPLQGVGRGGAPAEVRQARRIGGGHLQAVVVGVLVAAEVDRVAPAAGFPHAEQGLEEPE